MHNGRFHSLQKVLDFYNKGGGNGIGLNIPEQTLSPIALKLTKNELEVIKDFISALTDDKKSFN
jgi:cytochrome c peroxidase